jgi:SAM-dependent methyltransferase
VALKDSIRRRPSLLELSLLARNAWLGVPRFGPRASRIGATHARWDPEQAVGYIERVFGDYCRYGGIADEDIEGARVLEVGPGDSLGVALRFIGAGAETVHCFERFKVVRDPRLETGLYDYLLELAEPEARARMEDAIVRTGDSVSLDPTRVHLVEGVGIGSAGKHLEPASVDLIVSRAVLEYVYDMKRALRVMDEALIPGGRMAHKVDLGDHGLYTGAGHSPLAFLRTGGPLYGRMASHTGIPNRWRESDYVNALEALGFQTSSLITHLAGQVGEIVPHRAELEGPGFEEVRELVGAERSRLAYRFRRRPLRDLAVAGIFLTAIKPG